MKIRKRTAAVLAVLCLALAGAIGSRGSANASDVVWTSSGIAAEESVAAVLNPDCGFYKPIACMLTGSATLPSAFSVPTLKSYAGSHGVLHYRFGLERFSSNAGGTDGALSADTLRCLSAGFQATREAGVTAIVRFSYDINGNLTDPEPSMEQIEQHIAQLGTVIDENADVIAAVETGMIGPWGEQHTTALGRQMAIGSSGIAYRLVDAWLDAVQSRTVNVRRPLYYVLWAQRAYPDLGITIDNIDTKTTALNALGGDALRVGVFNDGYLGNASDLGTFSDRGKEVRFLDFAASHTLYGGEVVTDRKYTASDPFSVLNNYNTAQYISKEGYTTHTSYLNIEWNNYVVEAWRQTVMQGLTGADAVYNDLSGKTYVQNRLGYRLLLCDAQSIAQCGKGGITGIRGTIRNVGFGNVVNKKNATVILREESGAGVDYTLPVEIDLRTAHSGAELSYTLYFRLPADIPSGFYNFYLRFGSAEEKSVTAARTVRFANRGAQYDERTGGNYAGMVFVTDTAESNASAFEQLDRLPTEDDGNAGDENGNNGSGDDSAQITPPKRGCGASFGVSALLFAALFVGGKSLWIRG